MTRRFERSVSIAASLVGAGLNFVLAVRLLALWRSLGWESESEWEGSGDVWRVDSVKIVWGLLSTYFAAASLACFVGFLGLAKTIPSFVRFYRDYSIADFASSPYTSYSTPYVRTGVCEELSRHPDLMRDMVEMGLNVENCELWFDRAVVGMIGIMFILIVIRLHTLIALSKHYRYMWRDAPASAQHDSLHRIYLLPTPTSPQSSAIAFNHYDTSSHSRSGSGNIVVYAPIPVGGMSDSGSSSPRSHRHSRSASLHGHRHHNSIPRSAGVRKDSGFSAVDEKSETGPLL
ncbi:uncharacterized protein B0H18DRAFT_966484 [Fomitopsis serialis]|uniref:uncharacterized protein n=1 Tax=Fomitopsis serialis TaxID=139415 RepID=UPI0020073049|nr:uncharacterized protein B0H18DRAFT_966484 [Neoantrodia serialis]KAH9938296.1 hypothetical protein B0H18DRAFT_966484 [Neoantrodia serialis]